MDYLLLKTLSLRCGYIFNKEGFGLSAGFGLTVDITAKLQMKFDYAYTHVDYLSDLQRFSLGFSL